MLEEGYKDEMLFISSKLVIKMIFFATFQLVERLLTRPPNTRGGKKKKKKKTNLINVPASRCTLKQGLNWKISLSIT